MPNKVRMFSATFNNHVQTWVATLPAASSDDFVRMYGNTPNINLQRNTILHLGFYDVELSNNGFTPNFYIQKLNRFFDEESIGYAYMTNYFSEFVNVLRDAENEFYREQERNHLHR